VLRADGPNGLVRLKDVARIELGADNYDRSAKVNGARCPAWASTCSPAPTR
jgi:HAE1 family hydrophobic/amphiphilic exporter-1/multidrug efflux pump